jgi:dolichol-phosphate mannosyltransferase
MVLTVVVAVHNEEPNIAELVARIVAAQQKLEDSRIVVLFVDDGSTDGTVKVINELILKRPDQIGLIKFDRNYGHQSALLAGIMNASGDVVITMDGDLQHPPECIPAMMNAMQPGVDVVQMVRQGVPSSFVSMVSKLYHRLLNIIEGRVVIYDGADFRLMSANVIQVLRAIPERDKFIRGLLPTLGFSIVELEFRQAPRFQGTASYDLRQLFHLGTAPLFKYSTVLVKLMACIGILFSAGSACFGIFFGLQQPSYILIASVLFLFGINFLFLAVIGKLIMEAISQLHQHPEYTIESIRLPSHSN